MFLSHQTYTGILINVHSIIEMPLGSTDHNYCCNDDDNIQKIVLRGRVSQDPTEENFGRHRAGRRRNEHPSLYQFGLNMIRMSRGVVSVTSISKGAPTKKEEIE